MSDRDLLAELDAMSKRLDEFSALFISMGEFVSAMEEWARRVDQIILRNE